MLTCHHEQKGSISYCPVQFSNITQSRMVTRCRLEDCQPHTNFSLSLPDRCFWPGYPHIYYQSLFSYNQGPLLQWKQKAQRMSLELCPGSFGDQKCQSFKKIIVLYRIIPNNTLLSTFGFCAHLLHRNNMQNGCLLHWMIVIFFF